MNESELLFSILADVNLLFGYSPDISGHSRVRFTNGVSCNEDLFLIGTTDGAIATKSQYEDCKCSFAHLIGDQVMQHGKQIATRSDLLIWNPLQLHE